LTPDDIAHVARHVQDSLIDQLKMERYDLIVHDVSAIWGIFLGKILNRPYVCCFPGTADVSH